MATMIQHAIQQQGTQAFFLPQLMNESLQTIEHAHMYFEGMGREEMRFLPADVQMLYASEMSRITMRLSFVMAWCLGQRAVVEGEISEDEAQDHFRLEGHDVCLTEAERLAAMLPYSMQKLMEKTEHLYRRALRIDMSLAGEL